MISSSVTESNILPLVDDVDLLGPTAVYFAASSVQLELIVNSSNTNILPRCVFSR